MIATGRDTVASRLTAAARDHPDRPFLLFEAAPGEIVTLTYAETVRRAGRSAARLRGLGVTRSSMVHVHLENCLEFYDAWFGCAFLGAAIVPTNPLSTADELAFVLSDAGCAVSVTSAGLRPAIVAATTGTVIDASNLAAPGADELEPAPTDPLEPAAVLYTSGTTSRPKGVVITSANYLHVGEVVAGHVRLRPDDRWLVVLPLFHANAQYYCTMSALVTGASVALAPRFSAGGWARQAVTMHATVASMFGAPIRMLLAGPQQPDEPGCRLRLTIFGQSISPEQVEEFEQRFHTKLVQLYGMTETVAPPTFNPVYGECRPDTIGRPLPHARLRIVDEEGGDATTGELLVHGVPGVTIMAGYLNQPEITAATMPDGWLHTGDVVRRDEDGYLTFVDRTKDMIKRGGENVAAGEVERVVNSHPAVFETAVIGIPDDLRDEAIVAFVVPHAGAAVDAGELHDYVAERLARFKVPSHFRVVETLPRTSVGKVRKSELREGLLR